MKLNTASYQSTLSGNNHLVSANTSLFSSQSIPQDTCIPPQFQGKELATASNELGMPFSLDFSHFWLALAGMTLAALGWRGVQYFKKNPVIPNDKWVDSNRKNTYHVKNNKLEKTENAYAYNGELGHIVLQKVLSASPEAFQDALEDVYNGKPGAEEKVKLFLNHGSTPNVRNTDGTPAIVEAIEKRNSKIFNWLIENLHLDVNATTKDGCTALGFLCNYDPILKEDYNQNQAEKFKLIERIFAHPNVDLQRANQGNRLREWVSYYGNSKMVKQLHRAGIDLHSKIAYNQLPLKLLAERGELESVRYLLEQRPESLTHTPEGDRSYIVHAAAGSGNVELIQHLFERGASNQIQNKDEEGNTLLHKAAYSGNSKAIEFLLSRGALDLANEQNEDQKTPLMEAAQTGNTDSIKLLLDKGAKSSINTKDHRQYTALHYAAASGNVEAVKLLLDEGAKPVINDLNSGKRSPLHIAATNGDLESLKLLWANGADKSFQRRDSGWETILYSAVFRSHNPKVIEFLLNNGAASTQNKHLTNRDTGYCHFKPGVSMLDEPEAHSRRPVDAAVIRENKAILEQLLKAGAKVHYRSEDSNTPLHIAVKRGAPVEIVNLLFQHGAKQSIQSKNDQGKTPLDIAQERGDVELTACLKQAMKRDG